jgi:hypothetical protein
MVRKRSSQGTVILLVLIFIGGCSTMMTVSAIDTYGRPINDAVVLVDGENIGQTPNASTRVSNFAANDYSIRVVAEGYQPRTTQARKELKTGSFVAGIFLFWPWLWAYGPKAEQNIILTPEA